MDDYLSSLAWKELSLNEYKKAFSVYKNLITTNRAPECYPPTYATDTDFGAEFPGDLIDKPKYKNCKFRKSEFRAADGALSQFHSCVFSDCIFDNCDFRYCDIYDCKFGKKSGLKQANINNCNFSYGNFVNLEFHGIDFHGCSFRQMRIDNTCFADSIVEGCAVEEATVERCSFRNVDFSKSSFRYCVFRKTEFINVKIHILDLLKNLGLLGMLQSCQDNVEIVFGNGQKVSFLSALPILKSILPYYYETNKFFEVLNFLAYKQDVNRMKSLLPIAFERTSRNLDFPALQNLCTLLVYTKLFTNEELKNFYEFIDHLFSPDSLPYYLRKSYNMCISNIRNILVENPDNLPQAKIILKTDIDSLSDQSIQQLLADAELNIRLLSEDISFSIHLTKKSPYEILISLCGVLPEILKICQAFYYLFGGVKSLSEIRSTLREKVKTKSAGQDESNSSPGPVYSVKKVELSLGNFFNLKYEKKALAHVKSMEYVIDDTFSQT